MHRRGTRARVGRIAEGNWNIGWARAGKFAEWNYMGAMGKFSYTLVDREEDENQWNSLISTDEKGSQFCQKRKANFAKKKPILHKKTDDHHTRSFLHCYYLDADNDLFPILDPTGVRTRIPRSGDQCAIHCTTLSHIYDVIISFWFWATSFPRTLQRFDPCFGLNGHNRAIKRRHFRELPKFLIWFHWYFWIWSSLNLEF